jgi:hypothetical protein
VSEAGAVLEQEIDRTVVRWIDNNGAPGDLFVIATCSERIDSAVSGQGVVRTVLRVIVNDVVRLVRIDTTRDLALAFDIATNSMADGAVDRVELRGARLADRILGGEFKGASAK